MNHTEIKSGRSGFREFLSLFALLRRHRVAYSLAIAALAAGVALDTGGFLVIRRVVDKLLTEGAVPDFLLFWTAVYLILALGKGLMSFVHGRGKARCSEEITRGIRNRLYDHLQRLSFAYHDGSQTGELVQRATSDVDTVRKFFAVQIPDVCHVAFQLLINMGVLLLLEWRLALFSIIVVPVVGLVSTVFFYKIFHAYDAFQEAEARLTNRIQENLSGSRVVRAFARQDWEKRQFEEVNRVMLKKGLRLTWWHSFYWPFGHILCGLQFSLTLLLGGYMALTGAISPGTFVAFSSLVNALIWPMQELGRTITEISKSHVSYRRIREILDEVQEELAAGETDLDIRGDLEFRDAGFSYGEGGKVLDGISFGCREGETVALLGATGSGKTTLVNLLPRFYDCSEGEILLDGRSLKEYSRHFLRRHIGIVEQEPFLFSLTVAENIAYSVDRELSRREIEAAARAAAIHDSIMASPEGYDTKVGEKGVSLSGGQRQRIAIARTLLKDPRILIMDDSTSAVVAEAERRIQEALDSLMAGRTSFIIAHRVQTLRRADRILVLEAGKIVQQGTHEQLIAREGFYREVFRMQTRMEAELREELQSVGAAGGSGKE